MLLIQWIFHIQDKQIYNCTIMWGVYITNQPTFMILCADSDEFVKSCLWVWFMFIGLHDTTHKWLSWIFIKYVYQEMLTTLEPSPFLLSTTYFKEGNSIYGHYHIKTMLTHTWTYILYHANPLYKNYEVWRTWVRLVDTTKHDLEEILRITFNFCIHKTW